jgi:RHS repeat-associated protein
MHCGRVTTMVDAEGTYTYTYDNSNELTNVDKGGTQVESYAYDANGNRTGTGYSTTVMNETLTSPGVITYTYDAAGNTISANSGGTVTTYTYDFRNRLSEVTQGGTVIATYTYNALDQRIGIQEGGSRTWTVYNGTSPDALPYADFNGSGTLLTRYVSGPGMVDGAAVDELLARTSSGGTTAWYLTDKLDSVRDVVSSSGTVLDHVVYNSFGNIVTETNASDGDRFKFAGMEYDDLSGQDYDRARWLEPLIGRFITQDPDRFAGLEMNPYRYTKNGPTDFTDPTGNEEEPEPQAAAVQLPQPPPSNFDRAMVQAQIRALQSQRLQLPAMRSLMEERKETLEAKQAELEEELELMESVMDLGRRWEELAIQSGIIQQKIAAAESFINDAFVMETVLEDSLYDLLTQWFNRFNRAPPDWRV